jgi:hypothetical protein
LSLAANLLSIVRRITTIVVIAIAFLFGVVTTVYLSLRSPEVKVPDVVGKDRFEAEKILADADLNFRVRATRPSNQANPDTVLFQLPRPGEVVKAGQTVAMDISRVAKEGEASETVKPVESDNRNANTNSSNTNEDKPKPPKNKNTNGYTNGNTNGNANANANANANKPANANRTPNANRSNANAVDNADETPRVNVNRGNSNTKPANANDNRPRVVPKPSPSTTNRPPR